MQGASLCVRFILLLSIVYAFKPSNVACPFSTKSALNAIVPTSRGEVERRSLGRVMGVLVTAIGLTILPGLSRAGESVGQQPVLETMTVIDPAVIDFGAFKLPYNHENVELRPFLGKKATILFNMKIDDPQTVLQFPDLAEIYRKYKAQGLNVHTFPTEQGWFEPDDDEACRAKAKEFYSFGDYPNSVVFDKIDVLGPSAHPLYKALTKKISTPNGYGRITLNYEKFLLDADGNPVRRYPRKFTAYDMEPDLTALLEGKPLPEESPAFKKAWREAKREVIKSEYAFRFNYNYYDSPDSMYKYDASKDQIK